MHSLVRDAGVIETISKLKRDVDLSSEPFVWANLALSTVAEQLPASIKSAWLFVLKKNTWSGAHMHPNSVQHMIVLEGRGQSKIDAQTGDLFSASSEGPNANEWCVIPAATLHEFYPDGADMVVMSFHTCVADELIEVSAGGSVRHYEGTRTRARASRRSAVE